MDEDGNWSPDYRRVINIPIGNFDRDIHITQGSSSGILIQEGNGTPLIAFDGALDQAVETIFEEEDSLPNGLHVFNIRVTDINGSWSNTFKR